MRWKEPRGPILSSEGGAITEATISIGFLPNGAIHVFDAVYLSPIA
jgi:hypothetical protein